MQKIQKVAQKISAADLNPAYPITSINGSKSKVSLCGGILGIIFWIVLILLIIQKSIVVFGKQQVFVESFAQRNQDELTIELDQHNISLLVFCYDEQKFINYYQQQQYGIMVQFQTIIFEWNQEQWDIDTIRKTSLMVPCQYQPDLFCIPTQHQKLNVECQVEKIGPDGCHRVQIFRFRIVECEDFDPECKKMNKILFTQAGFFNNKFDVFMPKTSQVMSKKYQVLHLESVILRWQLQYVFQVRLTKLQIQTDQSILPQLVPGHEVQQIDSWFYPHEIEINENYVPSERHCFLTLQFTRSQYTERYKRFYSKVDSMLGQVLGFTGLISWLISMCFSGYNYYLMQEHILQKKIQAQVQNQESNKEQVEPYEYKSKRNFFNYLKQTLRNICGRNRNNYQHKKQIDLMQLYSKVERHEKKLNDLLFSMASPPSYTPPIFKMKQNRQSVHSQKSSSEVTSKSNKQEMQRSLLSQQILK